MTLITRLVCFAAISSLALAAHVTPAYDLVGRAAAHHRDHAARVQQENEFEERGISAKVGLAWNNGEDNKMGSYVTKKTKYLYTWSPYCPPQAAKVGLKCCPMLWSPKQTNQFRSLRASHGPTCLMGMNEVNEPSQANMTPQQGIALWNAELRPLGKKGYTLVAPSVTSGPSGITWLQKFFAGCGGNDKCGVHALNIHYYGTTVQGFKDYVNKFHNTFQLNVWVTEFACQDFTGHPQCTKDQVWTFMTQVTQWMDETPWIEAYFAFGLLHDMYNVNYLNQMIDKNGLPNSLGRFYLGF